MEKNGESIVFVKNNNRFQLKKNKKWITPLERIYLNEKGQNAVYSTKNNKVYVCLLYTSPSPRDATLSRMPSSA